MRDTRQKILETAKMLFNEQGFNVVSTGDIAEALGISKGNLTYYFKRKEDIMEALLLDNPTENPTTGSAETPASPSNAPGNLVELNALFLHMQQNIQDKAFYFWHHAQLGQLSPKIREKQDEKYRSNVSLLSQTMEILQQKGLLRPVLYPGNYAHVIDLLLISIIYWIPFGALKNGHGAQMNFQEHAWSILHPYLTEAGKKELRKVSEENHFVVSTG